MAASRKGRTERKAVGDIYSIFSQRSQLRVDVGIQSWGCWLGVPWEGRGGRKGDKVIRDFVLR